MKLLIDTNVLIWDLDDPDKLNEAARRVIQNPANDAFVSVASFWEMAIKASVGKLDLPRDLQSWLPAVIAKARFQILPVLTTHGLAVEHLPLHHRDPFDRLLIAQAMTESLTLVTADRMFERYQIGLLPCW